MADENNSNEDGQFVPDGSMEPLSPQEADTTDYGLMDSTGQWLYRENIFSSPSDDAGGGYLY